MSEKDNNLDSFLQWIQKKWDGFVKPDTGDGPGMSNTERISIFLICYILAVAMWSLVNLGREFELNLAVPVQISNIPPDMTLLEESVKSVEVTVSGEGWMLMNLHNTNLNLDISLNSDAKTPRINLFDYMRREISTYPNVNLLKVEPSITTLALGNKASKKVPVKPNVITQLRSQFHFVDEPRTFPDSVLISGALETLKTIHFIETEETNLSDIKESINLELNLKKSTNLISIDRDKILYRAKVSEFTEGEIRVFVRTVGLPAGIDVKFSPSVITIRYDVPIEEYAASQELIPFTAFVNFKELTRDTTGFITPIIQNVTPQLHLKLRSFQPKRVSYYNVINAE